MDGLTWLRLHLQDAMECQPYWHPLGFVSCLIGNDNGATKRLHYWPMNDRRPKKPNWPIHTHIFDLKSTILLGNLTDRQYELVPGMSHTVYAVRYDGIHSTIVSTNKKTDVKVAREGNFVAGVSYFIPVGTFHETIVGFSNETLTVAVCNNFQITDPLVLGYDAEGAHFYQREVFDKALFWSKVKMALS